MQLTHQHLPGLSLQAVLFLSILAETKRGMVLHVGHPETSGFLCRSHALGSWQLSAGSFATLQVSSGSRCPVAAVQVCSPIKTTCTTYLMCWQCFCYHLGKTSLIQFFSQSLCCDQWVDHMKWMQPPTAKLFLQKCKGINPSPPTSLLLPPTSPMWFRKMPSPSTSQWFNFGP